MLEAARLGPFAVRTDRARIEAYSRCIGSIGGDVPAAFPICWLSQPEIHLALKQACGNRLPLHESQSFEYVRPLEIDRDYVLVLTLRHDAEPPRLMLAGDVSTEAGDVCLHLETLLRLVVSTAAQAA